MKISKLLFFIAGVLSLCAAWMPWVVFQDMSQNGFMGDVKGNPGIVFIALGILIALLGLLSKIWSNIISTLFALCVAALGVKYYNDATLPELQILQVKVGYGVYSMILSGLLGLLAGVLYFVLPKERLAK